MISVPILQPSLFYYNVVGTISSSLIPVMTNYTLPSGVASANTDQVTHEAWRAFDGNPSDFWDNGVNQPNCYVQYYWGGTSYTINYVTAKILNGSVFGSTILYQISSNGTTWTTVNTYSMPGSSTLTITASITPTPTKYLRVAISGVGYQTWGVGSVQTYGY